LMLKNGVRADAVYPKFWGMS